MDFLGFALSTGLAVSITVVLSFAGISWEWDDGRTIATFVVFGVLLLLTAAQQHFHIGTTPDARLCPPRRVLFDRDVILLMIQTGATVVNVFVPLYYIPLYFQFVHDDTAIDAAVRLLPFVLPLVFSTITGGFILSKVGY